MAQSLLSDKKFRNLFVGAWVVWSLLHLLLLRWYGFPLLTAFIDSAVSNALLVCACMLITVIFQYYLPRTHRYSFVIALCNVLAVAWMFLSRLLIFIFVDGDAAYQQFYWRSFPVRAAVCFLIVGCMALVSVLWYVLRDQQEAERRQRDAEQLAREAELFKLRQQLQPHFLFNSLNSINALVSFNLSLARTMIQQLSDFLRGTIKREENTWISLEEELQHLQLYLDIEKVRFGHRLHAELKNEAPGAQLPALLLQPIVENAIKFGLYDTTGDVVIQLTAALEKNHLKIEVRNPFDELNTAPRGTGFGLRSVQRRLYLLFARADLLQTHATDHQFITTINIPQRD